MSRLAWEDKDGGKKHTIVRGAVWKNGELVVKSVGTTIGDVGLN